jgi:hypothetical protein
VRAGGKFKAVFLRHAAIVAGPVAAAAMVIILAMANLPAINLSNNQITEYYGQDLLESLEPNALLIYNYDFNGEAIFYNQIVRGVRTDVIALGAELLKAGWYVDQQRRLHPDITIPFAYYDKGKSNSLIDLIEANLGRRPVYVTGTFQEDFAATYDMVYGVLTSRLVKKGDGTDAFAFVRANSDRFINLHYPEKAYPAKYWESYMGELYGNCAFLFALTRSQREAQPDADLVAKMYRIAILNSPANPSSYKNLGILLWNNDGSTTEIVTLWEKYFQMVPNDASNADLRSIITTLKTKP